MLKSLMKQNRLFSEFVQYQLSCNGEYGNIIYGAIPRKRKWSSLNKAGTIENKAELGEFLEILKNEGIKYTIQKDFFIGNTYKAIVVYVPHEEE